MWLRRARSTRDRRVAGHILRDFTPILLYILNGGVSDFSISTLVPALRQGRSFAPHGRTERDYGLQSPLYKADHFCVKCSVRTEVIRCERTQLQLAKISKIYIRNLQFIDRFYMSAFVSYMWISQFLFARFYLDSYLFK